MKIALTGHRPPRLNMPLIYIVIKGVGEGSTTIIVQTSDGKYSCACSITIVSEGSEKFTPLNFRSVYNDNGMVYAA